MLRLSIRRVALFALLLSMVATALPTFVRAASSVSPAQGRAGERLTFTADGFQAGERIDIWATAPNGRSIPRYPSVEADAAGAALWTWDIPADATPGAWTMAARGIKSEVIVGIGFTVLPSEAAAAAGSVQPATGPAGTTFRFRASGFQAGEKVGAWVRGPDGRDRDLDPDDKPRFTADADGVVTWEWVAPADLPTGAWVSLARGFSSAYQVSIAFTLTGDSPAGPAAPSITPSSGSVGTTFSVEVSGFQPYEKIGSWLNEPSGRRRDAVPELEADKDGVARWAWTVPADAPAGNWQAVTRGVESRREVVLAFSVTVGGTPSGTPQIATTVTPAAGPEETTFSFSGSGFAARETVDFWPTDPDGKTVPNQITVQADRNGNATWEWTAPRLAKPGAWMMTAKGRSSDRVGQQGFTITPPDTNPEYSVSPSAGQPGTVFTFVANGFNVIEKIDTWVIRPDGSNGEGTPDVQADKSGSATWTWTAPADAIAGDWQMLAQGKDTKLLFRIAFRIDRESAPSAPPASVTPASGPRGTAFTFVAGGYEEYEYVGYWFNTPSGDVIPAKRELVAADDGTVTLVWTAPSDAQRGRWELVLRSSQSDGVANDVRHVIGFVVE